MKTAVVTGSTRGIGRAVAEALLARDINVVISSPDRLEAERVAATLPQVKARAIGVGCDVTVVAEVEALGDRALDAFGGFELWINNAGLALTGPALTELPEAEFRRMLDINLVGTMLGCQVAIGSYRARGTAGAVYNMLGAGADGRPVPHMIGYATSKAAVTFLTRALAEEMAGTNIRIGGLSPGLVITEGFLREHAKVTSAARPGREAVVNLIGDHPETIGRWAAQILDTNMENGRIFNWLSAEKIRRRRLGRARDILTRYA